MGTVLGEADGESDGHTGDTVADGDGVSVIVGDGELVGVPVGVSDADTPIVREAVGEGVCVGDTVGVCDGVGDTRLAVGVREGVALAVGVAVMPDGEHINVAPEPVELKLAAQLHVFVTLLQTAFAAAHTQPDCATLGTAPAPHAVHVGAL